MCVVVSLMVAGCGKDAKPERPTVVKVRTTKVQRATGAVGKSYMGTIEEEDGTAVHFNVMGTVVKVYVDEGQFVRKGQALAEVDGYTVRNAHEMSLSTLRQAEDAYRRLKDLYEKGTLPEIKMVEMETMLAKARASEAICGSRWKTLCFGALTTAMWPQVVYTRAVMRLPASRDSAS